MATSAITPCIATASRKCCSAKTKPISRGFLASRYPPVVISRTPSTNTSSKATIPRSTRNRKGTKAGVLYPLTIPAGGSQQIRLRLACSGPVSRDQSAPSSQSRLTSAATDSFADFDTIFAQRIREADAFYADLQKDISDTDARLVQRQAFAGMIWSKQFYSL